MRACVRTCKLLNISTIDKKKTVRSAGWRNILHSPDRYIPDLTAIRVALALKIFSQCYIEDSLVQAQTLQRIGNPHALQADTPLFTAEAVLSSGQHGHSFIFVIGMQPLHSHQRQCPPRDSSGSASALAEMTSQASSKSLQGDHLPLHHRPGLTASRPSNSCSKWSGCVRLSPLESLEAIQRTQTFYGRLRGRPSLSASQRQKTVPQLAFLVLGTNYLTGGCAIEHRQ